MDRTERKTTKIAREAEKPVLLSLREEGVGTAEIEADFYGYLLSTLTEEEADTFVALPDRFYLASRIESRAGFPQLLHR